MKNSNIFSVLILCLLLCGCNSLALSQKDKQELELFRTQFKSASNKNKEKLNTTWKSILFNDPKLEARKASSNNDFTVLAMAMGYHAKQDDAISVGLSCNEDEPLKIDTLTFGCVSPPDFMYKLAWQYNVELYNQKHSPLKKYCSLIPIP